MIDRKQTGSSPRETLYPQLLLECLAMARYALASGIKLPGALVRILESCRTDLEATGSASEARMDSTGPAPTASETFTARRDTYLSTIQQLTDIHARLSTLVAPATPRTILLLAEEANRKGFWQFIGPVPLIRRMLGTAIVSLIALIVISLSPQVNGDPKNFSLFANHGVSLLLNELFLVSAASIGASFAALFQASRYIQEGTFDSVYEATYWIRYVLGLMAGTMLAAILPVDAPGKAGIAPHEALMGLGRPLLALIGGFSASVVYRILSRLIDAVDSLVRGDDRDLSRARDQAARARVAEQALDGRLQLLTMLNSLQGQLAATQDPAAIRQALDRIVQDLLPGGAVEPDAEPAEAIVRPQDRLRAVAADRPKKILSDKPEIGSPAAND